MSRYDDNRQAYVNDRIRSWNVHVVDDSNGNDLGIMSKSDAISKAKSLGLDLVQISWSNGSSICKILDYGKWQYEQKHKAKLAKKRAKAAIQDLKEICFSIRIDDGDKAVKTKHVKQFLQENCKVKLNVQFSKREMNMLEFGKDLLKSILLELNGLFDFDVMPKAEGRSLFCIIKPVKR